MNFKIGVGLLLFGIILSNGATTGIGGWLFLAGALVGAVGLALIILGKGDEEKENKEQ